jgi:protein gp37
MADNTNIEWTDATWNVTHGCEKVATGCRGCYAIRDAHRLASNPNPKISGPRQGLTRKVGGVIDWTGVVRTAPENLAWPLHKRKPLRIFVNSNSDLFHKDVPFEFVAAVFGVMAACPQHTFQVLTKRPERMLEFLGWLGRHARPEGAAWLAMAGSVPYNSDEIRTGLALMATRCTLPNVWLGVSVACQDDADKLIPTLLRCPAAVRFISAEPLVGPVDLTHCQPSGDWFINALDGLWRGKFETATHVVTAVVQIEPTPLHWVIVGGESGPGARPCDVAWIRSIIEQCKEAGVPCFVKQVGSNPRGHAQWEHPDNEGRGVDPELSPLESRKGGDPEEWPSDLRTREFPTASALEANSPPAR